MVNELDKEYNLTTMNRHGRFYEDLKDKGTLMRKKREIRITPKTEQGTRKKSLEEIFGN